jgi:hypothetical protein
MDRTTFFSKPASQHAMPVELSVGTVHVRGLTRDEVESTKVKGDDLASEANLFAKAVTDPVMDPEEWREWFTSATVGDYALLANGVAEVSGIGVDATKSVVRGASRRRKR